MGIQLMPGMVGVTEPLASVQSSTSILSFPAARFLSVRLPELWKLIMLPPGKAPSQIAYSASSGSGVRLFLPACASELAELATAQLLACP